MTTLAASPAGFGDPVRAAQQVFRAVMSALAEPGRIVPVAPAVAPPDGLFATSAAILLALADYETPVWLAPPLRGAGVESFIRFQTGAPLVADPTRAAFAVADAAGFAGLEGFSIGTLAYPDRSATVILQVEALAGEGPLTLTGPGIPGSRTLGVRPPPDGLVPALSANRALFPRGVDLILAAPGAIAGLPRSTAVVL